MDERVVTVVGELPDLSLPEEFELVNATTDAEVVVAVGESALLELARNGCSTPVLPVETDYGLRAVDREDGGPALAALDWQEPVTTSLPVLGVSVDGTQRARALFDITLVTTEAAHISEFALETPTDRIASFRADGVVIATAAGTSGYARRLEVPVFSPAVEAAAVAPIAGFATSLDHWVVPLSTEQPIVTVTVTREEAGVTLLADDRTVGEVPANAPITTDVVDSLPLVRTSESPSCFPTRTRSPRDAGIE